MTHRDELREAIQPDPWEGPTDEGRARIQGARWRLRRAPAWRPVFGDEEGRT